MTEWQPFREPLQRTLLRTVAIAVVAGGVLTVWRGGLSRWPAATVVMLWPSFGGHWLELWFLNWLRPRLPERRSLQLAARLATWFVGGVVLASGMWLTAAVLHSMRPPRATWWLLAAFAGLGFIGVELMAHVGLRLRGRPSVLDGRG